MRFPAFTRSSAAAVLGAAIVLAVAAGGGAVAGSLTTSADIKDGTVRTVDLKDDAVTGAKIREGSVREGDLADALAQKVNKPVPPAYTGANWSIVDRNVIGNGDSYLRSGPSAGSERPPLGIGSLGIRTGSDQDKAAFGNQVDFAGEPLSGVSAVSYSVFTTGENNALSGGNLPNVQFEVNPHTARTYTTLVFVPESAASNAWTTIDASTAKRWYYTGGFGADSGCNQTTYCTLAEAQTAAPDGTLLTAQISKGRDYAFSGAVDALRIGDTVYDFEPNGVRETPAS